MAQKTLYVVDRDSDDGMETDIFLNAEKARIWAKHCGLKVREENTCDEILADLMASCGPVYYWCGICEHYHRPDWDGDCRDNDNRFTAEQLDRAHPAGWRERDMLE